MPSVGVTATTTHELQIKPAVKKKLLLALRTYAELAQQVKAIKLAQQKQSAIVEEIQTELEESSLSIEGFKATLVAPQKSVFDKKKFVRLGGRLDLIEAATSKQPGKAYVRITAPGEKTEENNE